MKDFNNPIPKSYINNLENVDLVVFDDVAMNLGDNINISITWSGRGGVYISGGHYTDYFDYQDLLLSFT